MSELQRRLGHPPTKQEPMLTEHQVPEGLVSLTASASWRPGELYT